MKEYSCKQYGRQPHSFLTLRLNVKEVLDLNELANRYKLLRHTLLTRALKRGLPLVIANLEGRAARARTADQAKQTNGQG